MLRYKKCYEDENMPSENLFLASFLEHLSKSLAYYRYNEKKRYKTWKKLRNFKVSSNQIGIWQKHPSERVRRTIHNSDDISQLKMQLFSKDTTLCLTVQHCTFFYIFSFVAFKVNWDWHYWFTQRKNTVLINYFKIVSVNQI